MLAIHLYSVVGMSHSYIMCWVRRAHYWFSKSRFDIYSVICKSNLLLILLPSISDCPLSHSAPDHGMDPSSHYLSNRLEDFWTNSQIEKKMEREHLLCWSDSLNCRIREGCPLWRGFRTLWFKHLVKYWTCHVIHSVQIKILVSQFELFLFSQRIF